MEACYGGTDVCDGEVLRCGAGNRHQHTRFMFHVEASCLRDRRHRRRPLSVTAAAITVARFLCCNGRRNHRRPLPVTAAFLAASRFVHYIVQRATSAASATARVL